MRSIHSGIISGSEAVFISLIDWWFALWAKDFVLKTLPSLDPCAFLNQNPHTIGQEFLTLVGEGTWAKDKFLEDILEDRATAHIYKMLDGHVDWEKFWTAVHSEIGFIIKGTDWFEKHDKAIKQKRKALKLVRGVMES